MELMEQRAKLHSECVCVQVCDEMMLEHSSNTGNSIQQQQQHKGQTNYAKAARRFWLLYFCKISRIQEAKDKCTKKRMRTKPRYIYNIYVINYTQTESKLESSNESRTTRTHMCHEMQCMGISGPFIIKQLSSLYLSHFTLFLSLSLFSSRLHHGAAHAHQSPTQFCNGRRNLFVANSQRNI